MSQRIYLVSLYYDKDRVTGANKRFDEIGKIVLHSPGWDCKVVVTRGNQPSWCPDDAAILVKPYHSKIGRLLSWLQLSLVLPMQKRGIVYSDFQPAPLMIDWFHHRFQLIHDLRNWTSFGRGGLGAFTTRFQRHQLRSARGVVTVSEFSKNDIAEKCNIDPEKVTVSYNGVNDHYGKNASAVEQDIDILYIATFESRKNHINLVKALELMDRPVKVFFLGRDLGARKALQDYIDASTRLGHVSLEIHDSVAESEMATLYQRARVFASPSYFEGFGMPLIEAAACGTQVVCSDIAVFKEIMRNAALYFDPASPENMAEVLTKALALETQLPLDCQRFRWSTIARQLLEDLSEHAPLQAAKPRA